MAELRNIAQKYDGGRSGSSLNFGTVWPPNIF